MKTLGIKKIRILAISIFSLFLTTQSHAIDYSLHGYYRTMFNFSNNLDTQSTSNVVQGDLSRGNDRFSSIFFGQHRLRLEPTIKINDNLSIHGTVDVLDNVLFGQGQVDQISILDPIAGTLTLPNGNGAFGLTGGSAGDVVTGGGGSVNVRRLYLDILTPVGKFRVGRQGLHWGMGLLMHDGNDMFSKFGQTIDGIVYMGKVDLNDTSSLSMGMLADFAFNAQEDPELTGLNSSVARAGNSTYQLGGFMLYQRPNFELGGFGAWRTRRGTNERITNGAIDSDGNLTDGAIDGDTSIWAFDIYGKYTKGPLTFKAEITHIFGKISTGVCINAFQNIPDGSTNPVPDPICLDGNNNLRNTMAAFEVSGVHDFGGEWKVIAGYAQGDSTPLSQRVTQFGFSRDYDVGLIMFNMPLGTSPAIQIDGATNLGNSPITGNKVNNAIYLGGTYMHRFDISRYVPQANYMKLGAHFVTAFAPNHVINLDFSEITGVSSAPTLRNDSNWYGMEIDLIFEAKFFDHLIWNITGGIFIPGGAYDIKNDLGADNTLIGNPVNPIIFDNAEFAYAVRSTLYVNF